MHDFGGFPPPLYSLTYPAPGSASLASEVAALLIDGGFVAMVDTERGFDHGAWVPLRYLRPDADTPVIQVSMPHNLDTRGALRLGRVLAGLRERGIVVMGSGSLTHNLHEVRREQAVAQKSRLLQRAVDNLSQGVAMVSAEGILELWNRRFSRTQRPGAGGRSPALCRGDRRQ